MKNKLAGVLVLIALLSVPVALTLSRSGGGGGGGGSVAIVEVTGGIADATGDAISVSQGIRPVLEHLARARDDGRVGAVVVRVNSGGGSAAASQEIHRAILKVRDAGKPVVVSMGDSAASGAYYLSVAADRILANPSTITGSIGVYIQFLIAPELAEEYGVDLATVKTGPYKNVGNPTKPLTEDQRAVLQSVVDNSLDHFVAAVAAGRGMDEADVRKVADGRILTGDQAKRLGLIDDFGGLEEAINLAAELAGIEGKPSIVHFRKPTPWFARYLELSAFNGLIERLGAGLPPNLLPESNEPKLMY